MSRGGSFGTEMFRIVAGSSECGVLAPQGVDPDLIRLALVVAALQRERHVLAADGRMNADIDLPQLSGQTVGEHLRFDDTDPGRGELPLD